MIINLMAALAARLHARLVPTTILLLLSVLCISAADSPRPSAPALRTLFITGGGFHDYEKLAPYLTDQLSRRVNATFEVKFGLEVLRDPMFAEKFDAVIYDLCDEKAPEGYVENALRTVREGKPTVMIH